jgi:hypothetical protein
VALSAFSGVRTAQEIVSRAERLSGSPGLNLDPTSGAEVLTAFAYVSLQDILDHQNLTKDFGWNAETLNFQVSSRLTTLPTNFWRIQFADPIWVIGPDGSRNPFALLDAPTFYARVTPTVAGTAMPRMGYIDHSTGVLTVNVAPDKAYIVEFHHMPWEPALASIAAKPWFPYSQYLTFALTAELAEHEDDDRAQLYEQKASALLHDIRHGDPARAVSSTVPYDSRYYRRRRSLN